MTRLVGGLGQDRLTGGAGNDQFLFVSASESNGNLRDIIEDFVSGEDKINVAQVDANDLLSGVQDFVIDTDGIFTVGEFRIRQAANTRSSTSTPTTTPRQKCRSQWLVLVW